MNLSITQQRLNVFIVLLLPALVSLTSFEFLLSATARFRCVIRSAVCLSVYGSPLLTLDASVSQCRGNQTKEEELHVLKTKR